MHKVVLLEEEVKSLRQANEALSKWRRAKKKRVRQGGALSVGEAQDLLAQKDIDEQVAQEMRQGGGRLKRATATVRRCGTCGKPGHNARICVKDEDSSGDSSASSSE